MIIYKCILNDDEVVSDAYPFKQPVDGMWEIDCKKITIGGETFDTGANASAEEADEALEDGTTQVIDVVHSFNLKEYGKPSKKEAQTYYKKYAKTVSKKLGEEGHTEQKEKFEKTAGAVLKKILGAWDDYDIYVTERSDGEDGMWVLINYREDGITPYATVFQYALSEYKV